MEIKDLHQKYGQSLWLDFIRRDHLASGEFARLVAEGIRGVTTNPSIFEKAIAESDVYKSALETAGAQEGGPMAVYEGLALDDIKQAADILLPLFRESQRKDGYVSMEVSPLLAHDSAATLADAVRLWKAVGRENLMIKVPGTPEGMPAIAQLIAQGINVNVTLLFARGAWRQSADAYLAGLEAWGKTGGDLARVASVASIFVSRMDALVDPRLDALAAAATGESQAKIRQLRGQVAIANAKLAYQDWKELFASPRWKALAARGARPQRLLWASTSTKDPSFRDVVYVESLVGPETVDTLPPETLAAFRDHGQAAPALEQGVEEARRVIADLKGLGIALDAVTDQLLEEGVLKFKGAFELLMKAIEKERA